MRRLLLYGSMPVLSFFVVILSMLSMSFAWSALPLDANGWSVMTPSADSRLIYVSSSDGNDATGTYYLPSDACIGSDPTNPAGPIQPYATYAAAYAQTRDGYPDWVLFKRGDTWTTGLGSYVKSGRGDAERKVIAAYGSSSTRPLIKTGTATGMSISFGGGRTAFQYVAIVGLHFYCDGRDPASESFAGYANGVDGLRIIGGTDKTIQQVLIEDCQVEWYGNNLDIQANGGTCQNVVVRRSVINNAYNTTAHSQGYYASTVNYLTVEECVVDHNGWYTQGNGGYDGTGGMATIYNHNTYFSEVSNCTVADSMFLRASSIQNKWRADTANACHDITIDNNLYVEGEIGMSIGGNTSVPYRFANITVTDNVIESLGRTQPTGRGTISWSIDVQDWDGGTLQNNLIVRQDLSTSNVYALSLAGVTNRNVLFQNNTIYALNAGSSPLVILPNRVLYSGNTFTNNIIDTDTYTSPLISFTSSTLGSAYTLANNHYYTGAAASSWFKIAGVNKSFAQWQAFAGESDSTTGHTSFVDATRTVETYDAAQGGPGTFDHFIAQAKAQSKASWNTAWTATAVNDWIRAGFNHAPVANNDSYSTNEDTQLAQSAPGVLSNDTDLDGNSLTASLVSGVSHGSLTLNANGSFTYTPAANYNGSDSFVYRAYDGTAYSSNATVTITVNNVNDSPVFLADPITKSNATKDSAYSGSLATDASDPDTPYGDTLTFSKQSGPSWLTVASNGALSGTPAAGDVGANSFTVRVTDASSAYADATMNITVVYPTFSVDATYNAGTSGWGVDHFATVQSAIDAAASGYTIVVNQGTYNEHVSFGGKNLTLTSTNPDSAAVVAATILDGTSNGTVVSFTGSETSAALLKGFTIRYGSPSGIVCNPGSPTISQNVIANNTTTGDGGGIKVNAGSPTIQRNVIKNNTATNQNGGGIAVESGASATIKDNLIASNTSYWNGAGIFTYSATTVTGNTIVNNTVQWAQCAGGALRVNGGSATVTNNIMWGNTAGVGPQMALKNNCTVTVSYSDVSGGQAGVVVEAGSTLNWGSGNVDTAPLFVNSGSGDFHLTSTSPCCDAADGGVASSVDQEGNARYDNPSVTNTGSGTPNYADMGCYEYH